MAAKNNSNENSPVLPSSKRAKAQQKYTECQLVTRPQSNSSKPATHSNPMSIVNKASAPLSSYSSSSSKAKSNEVQQYIQSQKSKRLHEIKSEKEKLKQKEEERKKRLQELYQKQRRKTATQNSNNNNNNSASTTPTGGNMHYQRGNSSVPPLSSYHSLSASSHNKTSKSTSNDNNNSHKPSNFYEQDMSKVLMDKISYLLNDNDKLVDRQRARFEINAKTRQRDVNKAEQNHHHHHQQQRSGSSGAGKRVEFNTVPSVVGLSGHYGDNVNSTVDMERSVDENNKENFSEESSFDYSSSATLTPNANSFKSDGM